MRIEGTTHQHRKQRIHVRSTLLLLLLLGRRLTILTLRRGWSSITLWGRLLIRR
jgi:hypothetical protein